MQLGLQGWSEVILKNISDILMQSLVIPTTSGTAEVDCY